MPDWLMGVGKRDVQNGGANTAIPPIGEETPELSFRPQAKTAAYIVGHMVSVRETGHFFFP